MDSYNEFNQGMFGKKSLRQQQELAGIDRTPECFTLPYKSFYQKSIGEYGPSMEDKIKVKIIF